MAILQLLQDDARNVTTESIAARVPVSATTVGARIRRLEDDGIIDGYAPSINLEKAGFGHHYVVVCTTGLEDDRDPTGRILASVTGALSVRTFLRGERNLAVEIVGRDMAAIERSVRDLVDFGVEVVEVNVLSDEERRPFGDFGRQFTADEGE